MALYLSNKGFVRSRSVDLRSPTVLLAATAGLIVMGDPDDGGAGSIEVYPEVVMCSFCWSPSGDCSHSIRARAISQVSRTTRSGSEQYFLRMGRDVVEDMAPSASAASPNRSVSYKKHASCSATYLVSDHCILRLIGENVGQSR